MPKTSEELTRTLIARLNGADPRGRRCLESADQVIVFGSMALGIERPDSDIDVLCVGDCDYKLKTPYLDLIGVSKETTEDSSWLCSELASHIACYGLWVRGSPIWISRVAIGHRAVIQKHRRVVAFITGLPRVWSNLEGCFRVKYSIKVRRETQRLILLRRSVPIPPTKVLDDSWDMYSQSPGDLFHTLQSLSPACKPEFISDLLAIADEHLNARLDSTNARRS